MKCFCAETRKAGRVLTGLYEEALQPCGLTPAQFELLAQLGGRGRASQRVLAEELATDQTTLSRNLKRMVASGWVISGGSDADRRTVVYRVTDEGEVLLRRAMLLWQVVDGQMRRALGSEGAVVWKALTGLETTASRLTESRS